MGGGSDGFTTTTHEIDIRPGGVWRFIVHGPDGTDWDNHMAFIEVVPQERLLYDHGSAADDPFPNWQLVAGQTLKPYAKRAPSPGPGEGARRSVDTLLSG